MYTSLFHSLATMLLFVPQDGWTALLKASFYGHTAIVKLLLKAGADTEVTTIAVRRTYLCSAASLYSFLAVCLNLNLNSHLILSYQRGFTALMGACNFDRLNIVKLLLQAGAKKSVKDRVRCLMIMIYRRKCSELSCTHKPKMDSFCLYFRYQL